ncbi:MAG: HD domain-containing protein [Chloroflexi bacterium]|nr:HD domain-containing protein [Chloroflexota bacterium]
MHWILQYLTSLYNYLLFHNIAELSSIVIAVGVFILAWNTRHLLDSHYLLVLGISFLFTGSLDLVHTMAYKGMNIFPGYDANLPTQLWIAARYLQSISFLIAPIFLRRKLKINLTFIGYSGVFFFILVSTLYWENFPVCFVQGVGLTSFKVISEYIISLILVGSIVLLYLNRDEFDTDILRLLVLSIVMGIGTELAFTFYIDVYGLSNLVGHFFKILSFYLIYQAIIQTGIKNPFDLLFRNLKKSEEALRKSHSELERRVQERTTELSDANTMLQNENIQRKKAEEMLQYQLKNLAALREIDMAITASLDLRVTLKVILNQVTSRLKVDAASILLLNQHTQVLEFSEGRGFRTEVIEQTSLRIGEGEAGRSLLKRKNIDILRLDETMPPFARTSLLKEEGFISYHCVPLIAKGKGIGVLEVYHRSPLDRNKEWKDFRDALAGQTAIAIENAGLFNDLQESNVELRLAYDRTLEGWVRALAYKDEETEEHSHRVTDMTLRLAKRMGVSDDFLVHVNRGALLHDIGKMGISESILLKPGKLTAEERKIIEKHPVYAYEWLSPIEYLGPALEIPYCHHEKWDGTGYPRGLKGEAIPLSARIFSVIDVWDALSSDRPYRKAWAKKKVLDYIKEQSEKYFDPKVVGEFLSLLSQADE